MANITYNFGDLKNKLAELLGDDNTGTGNLWPEATRERALNEASVQFAKDAKNLPEQTSGTVASMEITLPTDHVGIHALYIDDYMITSKREISLFDKERYRNYSGSRPKYYLWKFAGTWKIKLLGDSSSVNGKSYELFYFERPTTLLDDDSDEPVHDFEFRPAIAFYAAAQLFLEIGKTQRAGTYLAVYQEYVHKAWKEFNDRILTYERPVPATFDTESAVEQDLIGG